MTEPVLTPAQQSFETICRTFNAALEHCPPNTRDVFTAVVAQHVKVINVALAPSAPKE